MQFNSIEFAIFFLAVLTIYFIVPKKARKVWLLLASYIFYMNWNAVYSLLMLFSTVSTYICGLIIEKIDSKSKGDIRKIILTLGILINILILILFKYQSFILTIINDILRNFTIAPLTISLNLLLPVGISFYTFQALGYLIDVYRDDIKAEKNFITYALFVSFFPQLVAGPIERSKNMLKQINNIEQINVWNYDRIRSGFIITVWGYFIKMVIADRLAIIVDMVFDNYLVLGSTELIFGAIAFSLQIYCDFFSYSILAKGISKIIGIDLMDNFNNPYFASNIKDFWARWHISLSSWFKDYLYIPLGGNRKGKFRKYLNLFIVFLVSGIWHGANYTYVFWGMLHGFWQIIHNITQKPINGLLKKMNVNEKCFSWKFLQSSITFVFVTLAWIFFRAKSISAAFVYIKRIFLKPTPWKLFNGELLNLGLDGIEFNILIISLLVFLVISIIHYKKNIDIDTMLMSQNLWFEWLVLIILISSIFVFGEYGTKYDLRQFVYFQF